MNNKKRILSGLLALWLMGNVSHDYKATPNYEIINDGAYFANYSNGKVYIGSKDYIKGLTNVDDDDILIIDGRNGNDPNMQILSSYRIVDVNSYNEILGIIEEYEKEYPSSWKRSISSMRIEWFVHNVLYYLNYKTERTKNVDFNNKDEKVYKKRIMK